MRKITAYDLVSVDGFFTGPNGEIDWFNQGHENSEFAVESIKSSDTLIFGHTTYKMMESFWPTLDAMKYQPHALVEYMNKTPKIVFSKILKNVEDRPNWKNITIFHEINPEEIIRLKEQKGLGMTILGSGSIVRQFANLNLIDEYSLMVNPVILGAGKSLFKDVKKMNLELMNTRTFENGNVLLNYRPAKK